MALAQRSRWHPAKRVASLPLSVALALVGALRAAEPLSPAPADGVSLAAPEATGTPLSVAGVVTYFSENWPVLFVQSATNALRLQPVPGLRLKRGDRVEVRVRSGADGPPVASEVSVPVAGGGMPVPVVASLPEMLSGALDSRYVQTSGTLWAYRPVRGHLELTLGVRDGQSFRAMLPVGERGAVPAPLALDSVLEVQGVCSRDPETTGLPGGVRLWVAAGDQLRSTGIAGDSFARPLTPIDQLPATELEAGLRSRFRIAGHLVGKRESGLVYLQDATGGTLVRTEDAARLAIGAYLEAVGSPFRGAEELILDAIAIRSGANGPPPPTPWLASAEEIIDERKVARLVRVAGDIVKVIHAGAETHVILSDREIIFAARLESDPATRPNWQAGSRIEVTGVSVIELKPDQTPWLLRIWCRTAKDVVVLVGPPWLTWQRGSAVLAAVAIGFLGVVALMLRRQASLQKGYLQLVENVHDMIFRLDAHGRVTSWNRAAERLSGRTRKDVVGSPLSVVVAAADAAAVAAILDPAENGPAVQVARVAFESDPRGHRVVEIAFYRTPGAGRSAGWECVGRDITRRQRNERFQSGQKSALELAAAGRPLGEVLTQIVQSLEVFENDLRCCVMLLDSTHGVLRLGAAPGLPVEFRSAVDGISSEPAASICGQAIQARELVVVADLEADPSLSACRAALAPLGLRASWSLPIFARDGSVLGTFGCFCLQARSPDPEHLDRLRLVAALASVVIERYQQDARARATADRLRLTSEELLRLASSPVFSGGTIEEALRESTEAASRGLGIARASVWLIESDDGRLRCANLFERGQHRSPAGGPVRTSLPQAYLGAVSDLRFIAVTDVRADPRTSQLSEAYWLPTEVVSTLDAPIRLGGRMVGVLCLEHQGARRAWSDDEGLFAASLADLLAQALQAQDQRRTKAALRATLEHTPEVAVQWYGLDGAIQFWNPASERIFGFSAGEAMGRTLDQLVLTPAEAEQIQRILQTVASSGKPHGPAEFTFRRRNGDTGTSLTTLFPIIGRDGRPAVARMDVDITSRRRMEDALRASESAARQTEEGYREAIRAAGAVPYRFDREQQRYTFFGEGILALTGYRPDEITPELWQRITRERVMTGQLAGLDAARARQRANADPACVWSCDVQIETKSRETRWLANASIKVPRTDGRPAGCIGILQDVTHWYRAREELSALNAQLEERVRSRTAALEAANRDLNDFAHAVSHDLKAPLRGVSRLAEWIRKDFGPTLGQEGGELFEMLRQRVHVMHELVDGLLEYARVGQQQPGEETVDLAALLSRVVELISPPPTVRIEVQEPMPMVQGNHDRLHQVFQNLLDNAVNCMHRPDGQVSVGASSIPGGWIFTVRDNGPGIPRAYQERIFQLFQRLPHRTNQGTGVGLALVKRIVEARGGWVTVESEEGNGATFRMFWPDHAPDPGIPSGPDQSAATTPIEAG